MSARAVELVHERAIDPQTWQHTINGEPHVLHCHHYAVLYAQLAEDAAAIADGPKLLRDAVEDAYRPIFDRYFAQRDVTALEDRVAVIELMYRAAGLGAMSVTASGIDSTEVMLTHSHVDEGWIRKWGQRDRPVNYLTHGYLAAGMAAVFELPNRSYAAQESQSIVAGAPCSLLSVVRN